MTMLSTLGLLGVVDGRLMGDMGDVYAVISHFIGRPAYTHELPMFSEKARPLIVAQFPDMARYKALPWMVARDAMLDMHGDQVEAPPEWAGALLETRGPMDTIGAALERARSQ